MSNLWSIGKVAAQAGVAASTIRYYEQIGLLPTPERVNGRRQYHPNILQKLQIIRKAQRTGFSIAEIQILIHDFPDDAPASQRWQALATEKISQLNKQIQHIQSMTSLLEQTLNCQCATLEECALLLNEHSETS